MSGYSMSLRVPGCDCGPEPVLHDGCGLCRRASMRKSHLNLTADQRNYDKMVDPLGTYHIDFPLECTCHISPPCGYCIENSRPEVEK
jgi:hypothetical protein